MGCIDQHTLKGANIMQILLIIILAALLWILSAIAHERDMYRNLKKYGDAKAWTCKITSIEMKEEIKQ